MIEMFAWLKDIGFTPGAYGIYGIALMVAAWLTKEWRAERALSSSDRQAKREGFAKQVEVLTGENRKLLEDQSRLRAEYDNYRHLCQKETDDLRSNIIRLEGELAGYKRRVDGLSAELAKIKPTAEHAFETVQQLISDQRSV